MSGDKKLVAHRVARARDALRDAELLLGNRRLTSAMNRLYYALFYAASALLETKGLASSKHSMVRSWLNQHFVKPRLLPTEVGQFYTEMFQERQEGTTSVTSNFQKKPFPNAWHSVVFTWKLWFPLLNG